MLYNNVNRTHHASDFSCATRWNFLIYEVFYVSVSKTIFNNKQGDLYQVLKKAKKRDIQDVYLLYPMYRYEEKEKEFPVAVSESPSGDINVHFIRMPFIFDENEDRTRQQLTDVIKVVFSIQKDHYYE